MAKIKGVKGLTVHVEVNGVALPEYDDDEAEEDLLHAFKYIEVVDGAKFAVTYKTDKSFSYKADSLVFSGKLMHITLFALLILEVYIDGQYADSCTYDVSCR